MVPGAPGSLTCDLAPRSSKLKHSFSNPFSLDAFACFRKISQIYFVTLHACLFPSDFFCVTKAMMLVWLLSYLCIVCYPVAFISSYHHCLFTVATWSMCTCTSSQKCLFCVGMTSGNWFVLKKVLKKTHLKVKCFIENVLKNVFLLYVSCFCGSLARFL